MATTVPSIIGLLINRGDDVVTERWERIASRADLADRGVIYEQRFGVFLVDEPTPVALYALSPHNPSGTERVLFCPSSGYFEATAHGEQFDRRGIYASGPASRGLDRFDLRLQGDTIEVNVRVVYRGPSRGERRPDPPKGPSCGDRGFVETEPGFWGREQGLDA